MNPPPTSMTADVLYASDLHGHPGLYRELIDTAWDLRARALILGGDLAPHADVPSQTRFYAEFLVPFLREYHARPGSADVYYIAGNDDWKASLLALEAAQLPRLHDLHGRVLPFLDGTRIAGLASVPITPFGMKDWDRWEEGLSPAARMEGFRSAPDGALQPFSFRGREREESLAGELYAIGVLLNEDESKAIAPAPLEPAPLLCVFHGPPYGTALDQIAPGVHVGSHETRNFLERTKPLLGLHGHIHESPSVSGRFADRVGETVCVNAGQRMGSALHAVWFDLDHPAATLTHSLLGPAEWPESA